MRLTADVIRRAPQLTNTLSQRELDLRGLGITVLEEHALALLNDSFDVLNLSQNPLVRLEYFPADNSPVTLAAVENGSKRSSNKMMLRLQTLIVHRSRLSYVSETSCAAVLPNLRAFVADHNEFKELRDLVFISHWKKLEILSIEHNPVTATENEERLRAFVVFLCPTLKLVNYQRVTQKDRQNVESMQKEFAELVGRWRSLEPKQLRCGYDTVESSVGHNAGIVPGVLGASEATKKIRKRSRQARESESKSGDMPSALDNGGVSIGATAATAAKAEPGEVDDEHNATQARFEALEARMAAVETEEELLELQQELEELEALMKQQQASAKTKKSIKTQ